MLLSLSSDLFLLTVLPCFPFQPPGSRGTQNPPRERQRPRRGTGAAQRGWGWSPGGGPRKDLSGLCQPGCVNSSGGIQAHRRKSQQPGSPRAEPLWESRDCCSQLCLPERVAPLDQPKIQHSLRTTVPDPVKHLITFPSKCFKSKHLSI